MTEPLNRIRRQTINLNEESFVNISAPIIEKYAKAFAEECEIDEKGFSDILYWSDLGKFISIKIINALNET